MRFTILPLDKLKACQNHENIFDFFGSASFDKLQACPVAQWPLTSSKLVLWHNCEPRLGFPPSAPYGLSGPMGPPTLPRRGPWGPPMGPPHGAPIFLATTFYFLLKKLFLLPEKLIKD